MAATVADKGATPEEALGWERAQRPRAGLAALLSGLLVFGAFVASSLAFSDSPNVTVTDGFRDALGQKLGDGRKGLLTTSARWFADHEASLLAVYAFAALGTILIAFVLGYLFRATQARRPDLPRFILYTALIGPILLGIGPLISIGSAVFSAKDYVDKGVFSTVLAHDALRKGGGVAVSQGFVLIGQITTALALVLISVNAMKVGLFTRFMGILGCIVGALVLLTSNLGAPVLVQSFWLIATGLLILQRVRAVPPAWVTGDAVPWPSQQQLREQAEDRSLHEEQVARRRKAESDEAAAPELPSGQRRKRKRR